MLRERKEMHEPIRRRTGGCPGKAEEIAQDHLPEIDE